MFYIGTDIGGTFTDLILLSDDGDIRIFKALTTPEERTRGVLDAMELAAKALSMSPKELISKLHYFSHGTTAATNAFIERNGARTGLLTTRGFEDTLRIQRAMGGWIGSQPHEMSHFSKRHLPEPIVPQSLIRGIVERVDHRGAVIVPLDKETARQAIRELVAEGVESIAICLLWSFRNPSHELQLIELINEISPDLFVTRSSLLVPIIGEYERTSTTAINAYLGPVIHRYISGLEKAIRGYGFAGPISIMESGGGVLPTSEAAFQAANLLTSGPAGGVLASQKLGELLGYDNILTADMGGTSFDVGLIVKGQPLLETVREEGRFHVALPSIKVTAIGAGGGSIARVVDGHLTVGPESAGSTPGPACYRRGGVEPTITDADLVLGIIDPDYFLGGHMPLDAEAAHESIRKYIAEPLGMTVAHAAGGVREVANNQMADLLRRVTLRAGYDPRDFVLMAYGGAGPTHAYQFAAVAGVNSVIVPLTAPAHSAYGTVTSDRHRSFSMAVGQHAPARFRRASDHLDMVAISTGFADLERRARDALKDGVTIRRFVGMRFRQQVHEIGVAVPAGNLGPKEIDSLVDAFERQYEQIYGKNTALRISGVDFTVLRVEATSPVVKPAALKIRQSERSNAPSRRREVFFYGHGSVSTDIYRIADIGPGTLLVGPCIIERPDTTIVVGPGQSAIMEPYGNIIIDIGADKATTSSPTVAHKDVDPITFEVIQHRLLSITDEQAVTLASVSGSPLVNEATDFNTGLYRAGGEVVTMGKTVTFHAASLSLMVKHVIEDCAESPGINPGDMFIVNHPHKGALHCPDIGVLAPIFVGGERIGWTGACAHQLDVGGMVAGSFASMAKDIRQEGMLIPPVKLVDCGELRTDVMNFIVGMSRLPTNISLDLKGLMAANHAGVKGVLDTVDKYGAETVLAVMDGMMDLSETKMRKRLTELPDGMFRAQAFLDHDGFENKLYKIHVELRKTGDRLVFDYTGSDQQAPGFVNATRTGLLAGIYAGILPIIAYDLPWNDGLLRPLEVLSTEGSVVSCKFPAPCSQGPLGAMWLVEVVTTEVMSKLMATHPSYIAEAQAAPASGPDLFHIHGKNQYGEPATAPILEVMLSGGGAYAHRDGINVAGQRNITAGKAPNVEATELKLPVLYLYRRIITDSSGPGRRIGGQAAGAAFILHGVQEVESLVACHGYESPTSRGMFGGFPSGCNHRRFLRQTNIRELLADGKFPDGLDALTGQETVFNAKPPEFLVTANDVYECNPTAGGGWGDPLDRPPEDVVDDVSRGAFSAGVANTIFGVILRNGRLDSKATDERRQNERSARLKWGFDKALASMPTRAVNDQDIALFGDVAKFVRCQSGTFFVCNCGHAIAPARENWKDYARHALTAAEDLGTRVRIHDDLEVVRYACPACVRLLDVEVRRKGAPALFDIEVVLS